MPITTLSTLENQEAVPRGSVLKKLADFYGVPLNYFYAAPSAEMKATDTAKAWLHQLKNTAVKEGTIATYAPPQLSEELKRRIGEAIKQKKNG